MSPRSDLPSNWRTLLSPSFLEGLPEAGRRPRSRSHCPAHRHRARAGPSRWHASLDRVVSIRMLVIASSSTCRSDLVQRTSGVHPAACATPQRCSGSSRVLGQSKQKHGEANEPLGPHSQTAKWPSARTWSPRQCSLSEILNQSDVAASVVLLGIREPPAIRRDSHTVGGLPWRRAECPHLPSREVEDLKGMPLLSALREVNAVRGGHEVPL